VGSDLRYDHSSCTKRPPDVICLTNFAASSSVNLPYLTTISWSAATTSRPMRVPPQMYKWPFCSPSSLHISSPSSRSLSCTYTLDACSRENAVRSFVRKPRSTAFNSSSL